MDWKLWTPVHAHYRCVSHALTGASHLVTSNWSNLCVISRNNPRVLSHFPAFWHTRTVAMHKTMPAWSDLQGIVSNVVSAPSHCKPCSHVLIAAAQQNASA